MALLLKDKIALITGGTAGIGKAIAKNFLEEGARVTIVGRDEKRGEEAVLELSPLGTVSFEKADVSDSARADEIISGLLEKEGRIDILVNNAGITVDKLILKMTPEDWDRVMDVNVKSCYNFCRAAARSMLKARSGKIVNVSSVVGIYGNPGQTNYAASKAAMIGFTKALAKELGSRGVNVNCIAPGFIDTEMTKELTLEQREKAAEGIALRRFGSPSDIAGCALFFSKRPLKLHDWRGNSS